MQKSFDKFFEKDITFVLFTLIAVVTGLVTAIMGIIKGTSEYLMLPLIIVIAIVLFISYEKHAKNVMKGLMGAVLMWLVTVDFYGLIDYFNHYGSTAVSNNALHTLIKAVIAIVIIGVFVLHFVINSDHKSNPLFIELNQTLQMFLVCLYVADLILGIMLFDKVNITYLLYVFFKASLLNMVICIESKLDAYRIIREANGWKEK